MFTIGLLFIDKHKQLMNYDSISSSISCFFIGYMQVPFAVKKMSMHLQVLNYMKQHYGLRALVKFL